MDVTIANYWSSGYPLACESLRGADVVALDLEFSGLHGADALRPHTMDDGNTRYLKMRHAAEQFQMLQFGVCCFRRLEGGGGASGAERYASQPFNFWVFPGGPPQGPPQVPKWLDRRFTVQSSSVAFLAKNKFDFNRMIYEGIPYLTAAQEVETHRRMVAEGRAKVSGSRARDGGPGQPEAATPFHEDADRQFVEEAKAEVREWLRSAPRSDQSFLLPDATAYRRKLLYEMVNREFAADGVMADTAVKSADGHGLGPNVKRIPLRRVGAGAVRDGERRKELELWGASREQARTMGGLRYVWDEVKRASARGALVAGHNCLLDLCHLLNAFEGPLPGDLPGFCAKVREVLPGGVVDTKIVAERKGADGALHRFLQSAGLKSGLSDVFRGSIRRWDKEDRQDILEEEGAGGELYEDPEDEDGFVANFVVPNAQGDAGGDTAMGMETVGTGLGRSPAEVEFGRGFPVLFDAGFERYVGEGASRHAHEAGYDAFQTGVALVLAGVNERRRGGLATIARDNLNKLFVMNSYQNVLRMNEARLVDETPDGLGYPLVPPGEVIHVAGYPVQWRQSDLTRMVQQAVGGDTQVRVLPGLGDSSAFVHIIGVAVSRQLAQSIQRLCAAAVQADGVQAAAFSGGSAGAGRDHAAVPEPSTPGIATGGGGLLGSAPPTLASTPPGSAHHATGILGGSPWGKAGPPVGPVPQTPGPEALENLTAASSEPVVVQTYRDFSAAQTALLRQFWTSKGYSSYMPCPVLPGQVLERPSDLLTEERASGEERDENNLHRTTSAPSEQTTSAGEFEEVAPKKKKKKRHHDRTLPLLS